jgi:hypothetical protein
LYNLDVGSEWNEEIANTIYLSTNYYFLPGLLLGLNILLMAEPGISPYIAEMILY